MLRKLLALSALLVLLLTSPVLAQEEFEGGLLMEDATEDAQSVIDDAAEAEAAPAVGDMVLVDSSFDTEPELGDRTLVVAIHGSDEEFFDVKDEVHPVWTAFEIAAGLSTIGGEGRRAETKFTYLNYNPNKPMDQLADDFANLMADRFPGVAPVVVAHSAGARIAAIASTYMPMKAIIGIAPADKGAQGASLMLADSSISEKVGAEHVATLEAARARFALSDEVLRSLAWTNEDGVISSEDAAQYGIPVGTPVATNVRFYRHYGTMENYRPDLIQLVSNGFDQDSVEQDKLEWEAIGAYSDDWAKNDGILAPLEEPGETEDGGKIRYYGNVRHMEMLVHPLVLASVVNQIDEAIGLEPIESDVDVEDTEEPSEDTSDEPSEDTSDDDDDEVQDDDGDDEDYEEYEEYEEGGGVEINGDDNDNNTYVVINGNGNTVNLPGDWKGRTKVIKGDDGDDDVEEPAEDEDEDEDEPAEDEDEDDDEPAEDEDEDDDSWMGDDEDEE